jgi:hypothetical protein
MERDEGKVMTAGILSIIAGLWILFSPMILGLTGTSFAANAYTIGAIVTILALIRSFAPRTSTNWASWLNILAAIWLFISAFTTAMPAGAMWNNIILGVIVAVVDIWSVSISSPMMSGRCLGPNCPT